MNPDSATPTPPPARVVPRSPRDLYRSLPRWKKVLLGTALALMATGLSLQGLDYLRGPDHGRSATIHSASDRGLLTTRNLREEPSSPLASSSPDPTLATADSMQIWSPAVFRLGFGFVTGFCVAYTVRAFFKIFAVAAGTILLTLLGLQYADVIEVDWTAIEHHYQRSTRWLATQFDSFHQFISGYLPSSTMATLGAIVGFVKNKG